MSDNALQMAIINRELTLALRKVDKFHITRRRLNSRRKHLGGIYLADADSDKLRAYYKHLGDKLKEAGYA